MVVGLVAAVFVGLAFVALWPVLPLDGSQLTYSHPAQDPIQTVWFLAWTPFAVLHLHNPFFTNYLDYPQGVNLATNPSAMLLALLATPVTLGLGAIAGLNLLLYLALVSSALSMFCVLRSWTRWWPAAFVGALLFGFGSYMQSEAQIHLDLSFMALPPVFFWLLAEQVVRRRWRPARAGLVLGLVAAMQFLVDAEILTDMVIMATLGLVALAAIGHRQVGERAGEVLQFLVAAAVTVLVVLAYPLWLFVAGPQHLHKPFEGVASTESYRHDLLSPFLRNVEVLRRRAHHRMGLWTSNSEYFGIPLVCLLLFLTVRWRRVLGVWLPALLALVTFVLSLGTNLSVDSRRTGIPLPDALFAHLPILDDLLPERWAALTWLFVAILVGVGLDRTYRWLGSVLAGRRGSTGSHVARRQRPAWAALLIAATCVVALWPVLSHLHMTDEPVLSFPGPGNPVSRSIARHTPRGGVVLTLPRLTQADDLPMLWQADARMHFRLVQGYVLTPNPDGPFQFVNPPDHALETLYASLYQSSATSICRVIPDVVQAYHLDSVVVWPALHIHTATVARDLTAALGPPSWHGQGVTAWYGVQQRALGRGC